ncbi:MAG: type II toxin-antitoxin system VapC family toxin [Deltaproteobacteria bacterium]|nr:type II toxin-antitoxin system VapC family toxin [Deltaproteobacteria bacterium]MDE0354734.1 type II toxin-antitoxin system VapC family toxin [Deltaproteobacteria bacterium]
MRLTVDASVVVKWFVPEPAHREARLLLAPRFQLYAPALVLVEFANTIWKKAARGEVADSQPYFEELASLSRILVLHDDAGLLGRATEIAIDLHHPIYDCLYLACAEVADSDLITADRRFAVKAARRLPQTRVRYIGTPRVARWIKATRTALFIKRTRMEELIAAQDRFSATEKSVLEDYFAQHSGGLRVLPGEAMDLFLTSTPFRRLVKLVKDLSDEERIDLLALGWFGAGLYPTWERSLEAAEADFARTSVEYVAGYSRHWQTGYNRVTSGSSRGQSQ